MVWPKYEYVECIGFPEQYLPIIRQALDNGIIIWGDTIVSETTYYSTFSWIDCVWELGAHDHIIFRIKLLKGTVDPEALTVSVLQGKIRS